MQNKLLHLSMLYILTLKTELRRISFLWIPILPIQTFMIFILCIKPNFSTDQDDFVSSSLQLIFSQLSSDLTGAIFLYIAFAISIVLMCCFIVFIILKKPINQLDRWAVALNKLIMASSIFVYVLQIVIFNTLWHFKNKMIGFASQGSQRQFLPICIIGLFGIIFIVILNGRIRMLGLFNLFFAFLMEDDNKTLSIACSLVGIAICIYIIKTDQQNDFLLIKGHNLRKIMHLILTAFFMWKVADHLTVNKQDSQQTFISYIFLAVFMFSAFVTGLIEFVCVIDRKLPNILQVCQSLKIIEENPKDNEAQVLLSSVLIEQFKTLQKKKQASIILFDLKKKKQKDWTKAQWQMVISTMMKEQQQRNPSLESGINIIKCMLMRKDKQIFEVIQLLKELIQNYRDQGLSSLYQILKITLKIENQYFKKHQTNQFSIAHVVREVDRLNQQFYKECCKDVDLLFEFWSTVSNYKARLQSCSQDFTNNKITEADNIILKHAEDNMEKLISDINMKINKLQNTLEQIEAISSANREHQALNCLKFLTTYSHQHQEDFSSNDKNSELFSLNSNNRDYSQYLEMLNSKISKVSFKLASELGYKKLEVAGEKVSFLMPQIYETDIEKAILEHHQPVLKIPYYVPVLCSDNSILLKSVSSFLELDYKCGHRILLHFNNSNLDNDPILIYNTYRNMLQHYNKAFIGTFKINQSKIDLKIRNNLLNPDEIFKDFQLSEKNVQAKLSESGLETQYNCRMNIQDICEKKSRKLENVRLSLIENEKGYMILKVMKGYRMKSTIGQSKAVSLRSRIQTFSNLSFVKNDAFNDGRKTQTIDEKQNDAIFCKIQNPFESRINLKKSELGKQKKLTLKFYAIVCVFVAVLMVIMEGFAFLFIDFSSKTEMTEQNDAIMGSITRYTRLLTAYQLHYKYNLIFQNKAKVEQMGINYDAWLKQIGSQIEAEINSFQTEYLSSISSSQRQPFKFMIQFRYFNITTDTSSTNLFDFSQNILMYGNNDALTFLIKNYQSFIALSNSVVQKQRQAIIGMTKFVNIQYIVSGIIFAVSVACMVIFSCMSFKVGWVKANVNEIFKLMDKQKLDSIFTSLNSIKKSFMQLEQDGGTSHKKYPKASQKNEQNKNMSHQQKADGDEKEIILGSNSLDSKKVQKPAESNKINLFNFKYVGIYGYVFLIVAFASINIIQFMFIYDKIHDESMILNFKIENRFITYSLISQILEAENCQITRSVLGNGEKYTHSAQIALINSKQLPSHYFSTFMEDYFKRTSGNLCNTLQNKSLITFDHETCLKVERGLFAFGVPKTIQKINQNLMTINQLEQQFWFHKLDQHAFPRIIDIFYSQEMIIAVNKETQTILESSVKYFEKSMVEKSWIIFGLGCIFSLAFSVALFFLKKQIYKCSEIAVGYFLILPKKILLQNQVLDHMRSNDLLNKIGAI